MTLAKKVLLVSLFSALVACDGNNSSNQSDELEQGVVPFEEDVSEVYFGLACDAPEGGSDLYEGVFSNTFDLQAYSVDEDDHPRCEKIVDRMKQKQRRYEKRFNRIQNCSPKSDILATRNEATKSRGFKLLRRALTEKLDCSIANEIKDSSKLLEVNHIINGGFELRQVADNKSWDYYSAKQTPGWRVDAANGADSCLDANKFGVQDAVPALEFQTSRTGVLSSFEGKQFAELDSHCHRQGGNDTRVSIYQRFPTLVGQVYKLSFLAASRNQMGNLEVSVKNAQRKSDAADPIAWTYKHYYGKEQYNNPGVLSNAHLEDRELNRYTYYFTATSEWTEVRFADIDEERKTYGVLLDDVSVLGVGISFSSFQAEQGAGSSSARSLLSSLESQEYFTDSAIQGPISFYSLGRDGVLSASFTTPIERATAGRTPRLRIIEVTYGDDPQSTKACGSYLETMNLFIDHDAGLKQYKKWDSVAKVSITELCGDQYINLYNLPGAKSLEVKDTTTHSGRDGYDIDAFLFTLDDQ